MSNPNFNPTFSSNDIWRDQDSTRCLTDDLNAIEADISALDVGKAESNHTHSEYATGHHTHAHDDVEYPPMLFGVEYLTNEKWNGQPVYTTLVNCGNFADGTNVDTNIPCRYVVRHCGRIGGYSVPFIHGTLENAYSCWVEVSNFNNRVRVTMQGGANVGSLPVEVQVWYTKSAS